MDIFKTPIVIATTIFSVATLSAGIIFSESVKNLRPAEHTITVTGSTYKDVVSDIAKIHISINKRAGIDDYGQVNKTLKDNVTVITDTLKKAGLQDSNITVQAPSTNDICAVSSNGYPDCSLGITGYNVTVQILVETDKVNLAKDIASNISSELASQKINAKVDGVEYFFNGLSDLRITLLNEATKNAKLRAEEIAKSTGATLGVLTSANTGVFQVTARNSTEVSDYGVYDTSTIDKKVTAVVKTTFVLE